MTREALVNLLTELLMTHSPPGQEEEMDAIVLPRMNELTDECWQDDAGNIVGVRRGKAGGQSLGIVTHKDELGMIVKRVEEGGRIRLDQIGSPSPWIYGEGPVDLLGETGMVPGVLSFGARHVGPESEGRHAGKDGKAPQWLSCWVTTGLACEELEAQGVHIGTKAVIGRHRKTPLLLGDCIAGYALDCKASVAVILGALEAIRNAELPRTVHFIITSREEPGVLGGLFAANTLHLQHLLAVEVCPVAEEYQTKLCEKPVLLYQDVAATYDELGNRALATAALQVGVDIQRAVLTSFGSDASYPLRQGLVARANCLCFPTENTHGYEVSNLSAMENATRVLTQFLVG